MKETISVCFSVIVWKLEDVVDACSEEVDVAVGDQNEHNLDGSVQTDVQVGRDRKCLDETDSV